MIDILILLIIFILIKIISNMLSKRREAKHRNSMFEKTVQRKNTSKTTKK
ncbi:hypothetical protein CLV33_10745 [Jejuia pallidilutea]|uniref:Uncharacterized protein n=1 Tax=Jejuia pallidilutea TaxID=504487 RepID=A0A362WYQ3_9FLAO|nr:hypothetical protein CLV33_10745 [Jejuia pallidilutea]